MKAGEFYYRPYKWAGIYKIKEIGLPKKYGNIEHVAFRVARDNGEEIIKGADVYIEENELVPLDKMGESLGRQLQYDIKRICGLIKAAKTAIPGWDWYPQITTDHEFNKALDFVLKHLK